MKEIELSGAGLRARLEEADGALWLRVKELRVPLLEVELHDKMLQRHTFVENYRVEKCEATSMGARVVVSSPRHALSFALEIEVHREELCLRFNPAHLHEDNTELYRVKAIHVAPELLRADARGCLLLPIASGVLCWPRDKPALRDEFLIYGEQQRWELLPTLPLCAARDSHNGWLALATRGATDALCRVSTDGQGNGQTGLSFSLRRGWRDPVDAQTREIRFIPVPPDERLEIFCAQRLRRHCIEDLGTPTLEQRAAASPQTRYLLSGTVHKIFHAAPRESGLFSEIMHGQGMNTLASQVNSPIEAWTTFAEATACLQKLRAAGVERITTLSVGWNVRGHDGLYPTHFPIEAVAGGQSEFERMLRAGTELGYAMSCHDNYIDGYRASPDFDLETTIHDQWGEPLVCGWWGGGINYRQNALAFSPDRLQGEMKRVQALGVSGAYYCDAMGNPLEVNHHPRNGGPRSLHARGIEHILDAAREVFGGIASECGYLYAAVKCDAMSMNGGEWNLQTHLPREWAVAGLCDQTIPLWQLALHDLVALEGMQLSRRGTLDKMLFGLLPRTEWCARPGLFPVCDDEFIARIKADYDLCVGRFGHLRTQRLCDWRAEGSHVATRFEDGTSVEADYDAETLVVNGQRISSWT